MYFTLFFNGLPIFKRYEVQLTIQPTPVETEMAVNACGQLSFT